MDFVILVLTVCTLAKPETCGEERFTLSSDTGSLHGCMIRAQPFMAQWAGDHPALRIARWRCAPPGADGDKI
jgi:hypothetical protein